jgi:intraflagellar transport protein 88
MTFDSYRSCFDTLILLPTFRYKEINVMHPDNVECLRYLVHLCTELGRRDDAQEYITRLRKAEKNQQAEATAMATRMQAMSNTDGEGVGDRGGGFVDDGPDMMQGGGIPASRGKKVVAKADGADDDWGNEQLGDDLLPM